jgi:hypothetical protein
MATTETLTSPPTEHGNRHRRLILTAAVAAALIVAGVVVLVTRDDASEITTGSEDTAGTPEEIADGFLDAYSRSDTEQVVSYLTSDALLSTFGGLEGLGGDFLWRQATGFELLPAPCEEQDTTSSGTTVRCPYEFHGIRSGELGLGPYGDNLYEIIVLDGEIVSATDHLAYLTNGFSSEMWEPFAGWVTENHPDDAAVMYASWPSTHLEARTEESARLWEQHSQSYVQELSDGADADAS